MEKLFRVRLENGRIKDFTDEKEANAFEASEKLKRQQELERQKKAEEERRIRNEKKEQRLLEINSKVKEVNELLKEYCNDYDTPIAVDFNVNESKIFSDLIDKINKYYIRF